MTSRSVPTTPEGKFGKELEGFVNDLIRKQRFVIPYFTADPPETDPTNLWMRYDGRLRGRYPNGSGYTYVDYPLRSDITSPPAVPVYPASPTTPAPPQTQARTWVANWSQTYLGTGAYRDDHDGDVYALFGTDGSYGNQHSLIGFDYTDIATQLAGSTVQSISITLTTLSTYYPSGTTVSFGMHNETGFVVTHLASSTLLRFSDQMSLVAGTTATHALPLAFAQQLRAGTAKGVVLEAPNADKGLLGAVASVGSGYTPAQLTVTYAK